MFVAEEEKREGNEEKERGQQTMGVVMSGEGSRDGKGGEDDRREKTREEREEEVR
jgi:hypothetical protein